MFGSRVRERRVRSRTTSSAWRAAPGRTTLCGLALAVGCGAIEPDGAHEAPARLTAPALARPAAAFEPDLRGADEVTRRHLHVRAFRAWVHERPDGESRPLGYLRAGARVLSSARTRGPGCRGLWVAIEPEGYVCQAARDSSVTYDATDPVVRALSEAAPDRERRLPYVYGIVQSAGPYYGRLPTRDELSDAEPDLEARLSRWLTMPGRRGAHQASTVWVGGEGTLFDPARAWWTRRTAGVPEWLRGGRALPNLHDRPREPGQLALGTLRPRVGHALVRTFLWQGRRYGVSTDLTLLPTDRLRPIAGSDFTGVEIGVDAELPFALVRRRRAHYRDGSDVARGTALAVTGKRRFFDGIMHYETDEGRWVSDRVASLVDRAQRMPGWANDGEKWIDVSIGKQTLVLYEGTRPRFATLVSTGAAGLGHGPSATPRGVFRIHTKHVTATMSSDQLGEEFELSDVPYVQYFAQGGYALHAAYWHDGFGQPRSHGCINLSPEDARRVFAWTDPPVPANWHGALLPLRGTVVFIHD